MTRTMQTRTGGRTLGANAATELPRLFSESEAAEILGISPATLRRIRSRGEIRFTIIGRRPRFTEVMLREYIERETRSPCEKGRNDLARSVDTGSVSDQTLRSGVGLGSMRERDRRDALALALTILKPQRSNSRDGS